MRSFGLIKMVCLSINKDVWPASPPQAVRRVGPDPPRALLLPSLLFLLCLLLLLRRSGGSVLTRLGLGAIMNIENSEQISPLLASECMCILLCGIDLHLDYGWHMRSGYVKQLAARTAREAALEK